MTAIYSLVLVTVLSGGDTQERPVQHGLTLSQCQASSIPYNQDPNRDFLTIARCLENY